jgi:predicted metal-dependent hydrolase
MLDLKILGYHSAQRYAVRQTVVAAQRYLKNERPDLKMAITEVKDWIHIEQYTAVLSAPSLVVNEKLVCVGRFPSKEEVLGWLRSAMEE